jgi:hypothetical protein
LSPRPSAGRRTAAHGRRPSARAASVGRRKPETAGEEEFVRETVSKATGVHFEVVAPHPAFPLAVDKLEWFMRCRNKDEIARAPYLNTVWKEKGVGLWLESLAVGDTIDWIELAYGEERAGESLDIDYSQFDDPSFQAEFSRKFPIVLGRIREYEEAVAAISKRKRCNLEIRRAGSKGMLVFTIAARVDMPKRATRRELSSAIVKSVSALKEAYGQISKL